MKYLLYSLFDLCSQKPDILGLCCPVCTNARCDSPWVAAVCPVCEAGIGKFAKVQETRTV